jgi:hypothetical protein
MLIYEKSKSEQGHGHRSYDPSRGGVALLRLPNTNHFLREWRRVRAKNSSESQGRRDDPHAPPRLPRLPRHSFSEGGITTSRCRLRLPRRGGGDGKQVSAPPTSFLTSSAERSIHHRKPVTMHDLIDSMFGTQPLTRKLRFAEALIYQAQQQDLSARACHAVASAKAGHGSDQGTSDRDAETFLPPNRRLVAPRLRRRLRICPTGRDVLEHIHALYEAVSNPHSEIRIPKSIQLRLRLRLPRHSLGEGGNQSELSCTRSDPCAPVQRRYPSSVLEEGPQELPHLIVGPHHVEVEHVIVDQRENQTDALA